MGNKTITILIAGLVLLIFTAYFVIQSAAFSNGQRLAQELSDIIRCAEQNKWREAAEACRRLEAIWNKERLVLAINYAEEDYSLFVDNIARLKGAIKAKDYAETTSVAFSSLELWKNFVRVIPQP